MIASAGWSRRSPHYAPRLDSLTRAPDSATIRSGCARIELLATLCGLPLYRALGYREVARQPVVLPSGACFPGVAMAKVLTDEVCAA